MLWKPSPEELNARLAELRRHDPHLRAFGATAHRYELRPPTTISGISQIEETIGIKLPEDYRDFLVRFGNGGAGPDYGVLAVEEAIHEFGQGCPVDMIGRPFVPPRTAEERRPYPTDGVVPLAQAGCGNMWLLIATGPEAGTIWSYSNDDHYWPFSFESPEYPTGATPEQRLDANDHLLNRLLSDPTHRLNFWTWYGDWVERCWREDFDVTPARTEVLSGWAGKFSRLLHRK